jgi:hypothetical protein
MSAPGQGPSEWGRGGAAAAAAGGVRGMAAPATVAAGGSIGTRPSLRYLLGWLSYTLPAVGMRLGTEFAAHCLLDGPQAARQRGGSSAYEADERW